MIIAKVRAFNQVGWGYFSSQNSAGVVAQTVPTFMNQPIINLDDVTDIQIRVHWEPIVSEEHTGAQSITSYSLESDQASGDWIDLVGF
jgi:hypothetical protein